MKHFKILMIMLATLLACSPSHAITEEEFERLGLYSDTTITYTYGCEEEFFGELWLWCDVVSLNGKTYTRLYRAVFENEEGGIELNGSESDDWWGASDYATRATGYVINIREKGGRVYAVKSMYEQFIHELFPQKSDIYLGKADDPDEVLLYDFNLQTGDVYPCPGYVTVQKTEIVSTYFGTRHRIQYLSNGAMLVEGIGCVNSIGGIIAYQNTELTGHLKQPAFSWSTETEMFGEFFCAYWSEHGIDLWNLSPIPSHISSPLNLPKSSAHKYYDLSGRRLSAPPAKGMYIEDKRVKIRE